MKNIVLPAIILTVLYSTPTLAEEINNGTNPTLLSTNSGVQFQYTDIGSGLTAGLYETFYTQPFGEKKNMAWNVSIPYSSGAIDKSYGLGDVSLKFTHVPIVTPKFGIAYTAKLNLDTAGRPELGSGQTSLEISGFYANFLENGSILAPALVHQIGLGDEDPGRSRINQTTFDLYYVPKLSNPNYFVTLDPAVIQDWENDKTYGSLQVTMGMQTGKLFDGDSQIFIKPGILIGSDRPADWTVQVGFKVIGF